MILRQSGSRRARGGCGHHGPFGMKGPYGASGVKSMSLRAASVTLPDSDG